MNEMNKTAISGMNLLFCALFVSSAFSIDFPACAKGKNQAKKAQQNSAINYNDPDIKEVKAAYDAGRWKDALKKIALMKPNELTHYYTGLCYQGQNQLAKAASEFQWIATYGTDARLKYNSQVILNSLQAYSSRRTYQGQGNNFAGTSAGYSRSGGSRRG